MNPPPDRKRAERIAGEISRSKKYAPICREAVINAVLSEQLRYKTDREILKAAKNSLHRACGAFFGHESISRAFEPAGCGETTGISGARLENAEAAGTSFRLMKLHSSTRERLSFMQEFYEDIFSVLPKRVDVLDIACGLNPLALPLFCQEYISGCTALDMNAAVTGVLERFFTLYYPDFPLKAISADVMGELPRERFGAVFLFKILPVIQRQGKFASAELINRLCADFFCVSFPTLSMSGKNVGMADSYSAFTVELCINAGLRSVFEKKYKNELLYIFRRETDG